MASYQVTCITKPDRSSTHEHITHIGGSWGKFTREDAIKFIDSKQHEFYMQAPDNQRSEVRVVRESGENPYLRTYADGIPNNNLLALNEC